MSKTTIPQKVQSAVWARAAGRCQYRGCNCELVGDLVAGRQHAVFGFLAHIVADSAPGPRGDIVRSPLLAKEPDNLMLLCSTHHKLIDVVDVDGHLEPVLLAMKAEHEARVRLLVGIDPDRASHVLRFGAAIGVNEALVSTADIFAAMVPERHPASAQTIDLEMTGCSFTDGEPEFWTLQQANLRRNFTARLAGRIERQEIRHLSVFALAPQPLLIELGRLLGDIVPCAVHQRHREPSSWAWQRDCPTVQFTTSRPASHRSGPVALSLGVSAPIADERIEQVLGGDAAVWSLTVEAPHNDIIRCEEDQVGYRATLRALFDAIKSHHGEGAAINVFPALPASLAVETGRVWMPKAHPAMIIYDQQPGRGFAAALEIFAPNSSLSSPTFQPAFA